MRAQPVRAQGDYRPPAPLEPSVTWRTVVHETPVFVDESGRRAHAVRAVAVTVAVLCSLWLGALVVGVSGFASFPSVRPLVAGLPVVARTTMIHARVGQFGARELAGFSSAGRPRAVGAADADASADTLSACSGGRPTAGPHDLGGRPGSGRSHGLAGRTACETEFAASLRRPRSHLV